VSGVTARELDMTIERNSRKRLSGWNIAEGTFLAIVFAIIVGGVSIWTYECSTSTGPFRREYSGRIVDKRISVFESEQGSFFSNKLVIEEKRGRRFTVSVSEEIYNRAKPGMWIQKTSRGIELSTEPKTQ
jgi:hypothetical protein